LEEFDSEFGKLERLWKGKKHWEMLYAKWKPKIIFDIDYVAMTDEMEKLQKTSMICAKGLPMNKAAKNFKKTIDEFNFISIIITALNNDAMSDEEDHWNDVRNKYRSKTGK